MTEKEKKRQIEITKRKIKKLGLNVDDWQDSCILHLLRDIEQHKQYQNAVNLKHELGLTENETLTETGFYIPDGE